VLLLSLATLSTSYSLDEDVFRALNLVGTNAVLDAVMVLFTTLSLAYVMALLVFPLWWRGHKDAAFDFLILLVAAMAVTEAIKFALNVPRPCDVLSGVQLLTPSSCAAEIDPAFPSGHTSRAFALAGFLAWRFPGRAGFAGLGFAILSGVSRIYLGVHWPSDVVGGAALGLGLVLVLREVDRRSGGYRAVRERVVAAIARAFSRKKPA